MTTQIDWQQELDASFGSGDDVPVGHYVAAGRRAVRRRRRTAVVSGLAAAVVVAGVAWGVAPDRTSSGGEAPLATDPSATSAAPPSGSPTVDTATGGPGWATNEPPARTTPGGGLEIREGAVVHERRDDLYPGKDTESVALDVSHDGQRWWMTLEWDDGGAAMSSERPEDGLHESFDAFVATAAAGTGMTSGPADEEAEGFHGGLVEWTGGEPRPRKDVEVLRVVDDPVATADDSIGLVLQRRGAVTWMLIELDDRSSSASYTLEADSGWATFDQWLEDQLALQAGEPGVRLVELGAGSRLVAARPDVTVLEQQPDPVVPAYGTEGDGPSAVALVEWAGARWFVLAVRLDGDDAITTVAASKAGGAETLAEFVAFMADRADEGGMR